MQNLRHQETHLNPLEDFSHAIKKSREEMNHREAESNDRGYTKAGFFIIKLHFLTRPGPN